MQARRNILKAHERVSEWRPFTKVTKEKGTYRPSVNVLLSCGHTLVDMGK